MIAISYVNDCNLETKEICHSRKVRLHSRSPRIDTVTPARRCPQPLLPAAACTRRVSVCTACWDEARRHVAPEDLCVPTGVSSTHPPATKSIHRVDGAPATLRVALDPPLGALPSALGALPSALGACPRLSAPCPRLSAPCPRWMQAGARHMYPDPMAVT